MELKVKFLPSLLQCTFINRCALTLKTKKKKIILPLIKILFFPFLSFLFLFFSELSQHSTLSLSQLSDLSRRCPPAPTHAVDTCHHRPNSNHPFHWPNSPTQAPSPKPKKRCTSKVMRLKHNRKPKHGEDVDSVGNIDVGLILHWTPQ